MQVRIHDLVHAGEPKVADLAEYLRSVHLRFRNSIHAATRVYTCRGAAEPHELHWNADDVPGEDLIGTIGYSSAEVLPRVEAILAAGDAVRLFIFNSDSDLCFQEILVAA